MGLNTENLFVRIDASDEVKAAVEDYLQGPPDVAHSHWPLQVTFDQSRVTRGRRISVSDARNGWVAVVDSSETVDPNLAVLLSDRLSTRVAIAQLYEVTGSSGFAMVERGIARGGPTHNDLDDPLGAVTSELAKEGIPFVPVLFRDTVGKQAVGWHAISRARTA
jgi:hypothetical protein